eukprot:2035144-Rhodomonas_salina.12
MCVFGAQYWYSAGLRSAVTDTASAAHGTHTVCCHTACVLCKARNWSGHVDTAHDLNTVFLLVLSGRIRSTACTERSTWRSYPLIRSPTSPLADDRYCHTVWCSGAGVRSGGGGTGSAPRTVCLYLEKQAVVALTERAFVPGGGGELS